MKAKTVRTLKFISVQVLSLCFFFPLRWLKTVSRTQILIGRYNQFSSQVSVLYFSNSYCLEIRHAHRQLMLILVGHVLAKGSRQTNLQKSGSCMNQYINYKIKFVNQYHIRRKRHQISYFYKKIVNQIKNKNLIDLNL